MVVGALDGLDAIIFFGLRGAEPLRIFQAIASGLIGPSAFDGGVATGLLGVALHFLIAFGIVSIYYLASRRVRALVERPFLYGAIYGIAVYLVMNFAVIPLSAVTRGPFLLPVVINGLLIHMLGVGIPSALFARAAVPPADRPTVAAGAA